MNELSTVPAVEEKIPEISLKKRFVNLHTLISFIIALGLLVFVILRLDIDFSAAWSLIRSSNLILYALSFSVYYLSFLWRGWRWRLLLGNAGLGKSKEVNLPSIFGLSGIILIGFFANCILYAKLGDVYRAYLLKQNAKASFSKTVGTVVVERILDLASIFVLLVFAGLALWGTKSQGIATTFVVASFIVVVVPILVVLAMWRFSHVLEKRLPLRLRAIYTLFREGTLGSFRQLPLLILISLVIWLLEAGRTFLVAEALGLPLSPFVFIFVAPALALLTALPFTPGGLGLVEVGMVGLFIIFLPREAAWSIVLLDRTISYLSLIFFGFLYFLLYQLGVKRRQQSRNW